jgi:hypothetical protein
LPSKIRTDSFSQVGTGGFRRFHGRDDLRAIPECLALKCRSAFLLGVDLRPQPPEERKGSLQHVLREVTGGRYPVQRAHRGGRRDHCSARLQAGFRGHRLQAQGSRLPIGAVKGVDQGENPRSPGLLRFEDRT